ncbi:glycosylphosphatidylinositol anchor biosynthesis [Saxophila tyrrhenica]|uniref:Mannosyltransferase n=1 Tax=Saxophila tyrrhenica TaxID=1690608 RepID=A0AAV9PFT1_9PEZI|nr:glycosylphosphatidylinositol anchor biosynthesis [Saxophila tyrrhenica]
MGDQPGNKHDARTSSMARTAPQYMGALFVGLLVLRIINALMIKTSFQPDEYFQSLEPALETAFGPSVNAWITWEWHERLRSSLHPLLFASIYNLADSISTTLGLTPSVRAEVLVAAPKVLQAVFAALTDAYTYRLACDIYGSKSHASAAALVLSITSPWQWFASVRTLSNSMETTLTIIALRLWPWDLLLGSSPEEKQTASNSSSTGLYGSLCAAAIACILRPTNIIIWATISITVVFRYGGKQAALRLATAASICGSAVLAVSVAADRAFYDELVLPPLRFLHFNVVQSLAVFYGQNRLDYYITEGLPLLLTTALPFGAVALWQALYSLRKDTSSSNAEYRMTAISSTLALTVITSVLALGGISHKEVRFIYPLLPMLHVLAAEPFSSFFRRPARPSRIIILTLAAAINVAVMYYTSYVHQRGVVDVMHYLRHQHEKKLALSSTPGAGEMVATTVAFLMPCHSTPWRSHLVYPEIEAGALTCEPPIGLSVEERLGYMDEADVFYANPIAWVEDNMANTASIRHGSSMDAGTSSDDEKLGWPQYLVFFQQLEPTMKEVLEGTKYRECWRGFNTHFHDDWRRNGDVVVWCMAES